MVANAITIIDPAQAIQQAKAAYEIVRQMKAGHVLRDSVDYGIVPGTAKPTLLKPGAERLCSAFGLAPRFETIEAVQQWDTEKPLFHYRILCRLIRIEDGKEIATGIGSCNSMESKYRWRWVKETDLPRGIDKAMLESRKTAISEFEFAINRAETTGDYGKPSAYWQQFKDAIANGSAKPITRATKKGPQKAYEIAGVLYRVPNDDIYSQVNTIEKMACKRALIAAVLIGTNASEFFTQDLEDMRDFSGAFENIIEGEFTEVTPSPDEKLEAPKAAANGNVVIDWTTAWKMVTEKGLPRGSETLKKLIGVDRADQITPEAVYAAAQAYNPLTGEVARVEQY